MRSSAVHQLSFGIRKQASSTWIKLQSVKAVPAAPARIAVVMILKMWVGHAGGITEFSRPTAVRIAIGEHVAAPILAAVLCLSTKSRQITLDA